MMGQSFNFERQLQIIVVRFSLKAVCQPLFS